MVRLQTASPPSSGHELTGLYKEHAAEVFRFALHLTGRPADAEDIVQQVFLLAHRHLESGRDLVSARSWLLTAAKHRAFNLSRDRREVPVSAAPLALAPDPPDTDEVALLTDVRAMLWTLPEPQHHAFVLRHWSGLSQREIAAVLDTTPAAVESLLVRARAALLGDRRMASDACRRVRRRLVDAIALSDDDSHHMDSCRRCRQAQARLAQAADVGAVLALAPPVARRRRDAVA